MGRNYRVGILPGDGIGPEVIPEAVRVLEASAAAFGFNLSLHEGLIGQAALDATGRLLPRETLELASKVDAFLVGPVGGSRWENTSPIRHPKQALIKLRAVLGTYATLWPIHGYAYLTELSPLKSGMKGVDLLVTYDHSAGLLYGQPRGISSERGVRRATNTLAYSAPEIERVARVAFESAISRKQRLTSVDQAKILETGELWRDVVSRVAQDYPDVCFQRMDADNFLFELARNPGGFDVVLADSVLGELIGATAAGLTGTYAIHPKAYLGPATGIFQPSHGAASDIAGRGTADPVGAIRAAGLLLGYGLGEREAARVVERAVDEVLKEHYVPAEIDPEIALQTREVGEAVALTFHRLAVGRTSMPIR